MDSDWLDLKRQLSFNQVEIPRGPEKGKVVTTNAHLFQGPIAVCQSDFSFTIIFLIETIASGLNLLGCSHFKVEDSWKEEF